MITFANFTSGWVGNSTLAIPTFESMENSITKAHNTDATALSTLVNSAYRGDSSRAGWTTEADLLDGTRTDAAAIEEAINTTGTTILKYEEAGAIRGCVELKITGRKLYLGMLTVSPDMQGKGTGKKLLKAAEVFAAEQGCNSVYMTVISVRSELIEWYVRHGYTLTGERKPFAFNDIRFGLPKQPLEFIVLEKQL